MKDESGEKVENKDEQKRDIPKTRYDDITAQLLKCHICNKSMWDGRSFENHLSGRAHAIMLQKTAESYALTADTMRQEFKVSYVIMSCISADQIMLFLLHCWLALCCYCDSSITICLDTWNETYKEGRSTAPAWFLLRHVWHVRGGWCNPPDHCWPPEAEEVPAPNLYVVPQGDANSDRAGWTPTDRRTSQEYAGQAGTSLKTEARRWVPFFHHSSNQC